MAYIPNILFAVALIAGGGYFALNLKKIIRNINLGKPVDRTDRKNERLKTMMLVAFGQSKMVTRPIAGFMHIVIYAGFLLINIEVLEIVIDGLLGTHRIFAAPLGGLYNTAIGFFEVLAVGVIIVCLAFLWRRNVQKIDRFHKPEMKGWPFKDANYILVIEIVLMIALLTMNAAEANFDAQHQVAGPFLISQFLAPLFSGFDQSTLHFIERFAWWGHILGILAFLNYLPFSKHFHIMMAFPNTYYSDLTAKGKFTNLESVRKEVELMMDPSADPYAAPAEDAEPPSFGAKDVKDLTWKQLMDAYTCTECGRCTSVCPANNTGKLLSPRKIMMDTRDRLVEVGNNIDTHGADYDDGKTLVNDYITPEELWACTTCNACAEACPVNIDPVGIIIDLRRSLVMEESKAPGSLNAMFTNIENNSAPWQFSPADRLNWRDEN
jgi:ferredoxin